MIDLIDAKSAKWIRMFEKSDLETQRSIGENMCKLNTVITKQMSPQILYGNKYEVSLNVSLDNKTAATCIKRTAEMCDEKGWLLRGYDQSFEYIKTNEEHGIPLEYGMWDIRLRLEYGK